MAGDWKLFYRRNDDGSVDFAEILDRDDRWTLRRGAVFTSGKAEPIDVAEPAEQQLSADGYELHRSWTFDRADRDVETLEKEILAVIRADPSFADTNALALITDSSLMTVGFALQSFPNLDEADDEEIWIVDEWEEWSEDWRLDPAYRWMLAYGFNDELEGDRHEQYCDQVRDAFKAVLRACAGTKDVLLIYVGGDDEGHQWSVDLMEEKLSKRMMDWI